MTPALLIDAIVRQTSVLIAALATAAGQRAPLAHVADQVFADLVAELKEQGIGSKVIADMFGLALRSYHKRVARLTESGTIPGRSLWEAVLDYVQQTGSVQRTEVLQRFSSDDETTVRGVLRDLVESGVVQVMGRGDATRYHSAPVANEQGNASRLDPLLLVAIHRNGPIGRADLEKNMPQAEPEAIDAALERLVTEGVVAEHRRGGTVDYECESCVVALGESAGWEAAVYDHYQALVAAIVAKLRMGKRRADAMDQIGGSTFVFDLWEGHPLAEEVLGHLRDSRERGMALRQKVLAHGRDNPKPTEAAAVRVVAYVGQVVQRESEEED